MKTKLRLMMTMLLLAVMGSVYGQTTATDVLNRFVTGAGVSYINWNYSFNSGAVYNGTSAGGNDCIQLRGSNNSGIVCTTSPGKVKKVTVVWNASTTVPRTLDVYGKNAAYSQPSDLYSSSSSTKGDKLGSMTYNGTPSTTELTIDGDYSYIGLRSNNNAMFLESITITWELTEIVTHNVTFYANGDPISTETVEEGKSIVFPANPLDEADYKFIGWSTADWTGEVNDLPSPLVTSATMGTTDMAIYAVYAIVTEGSGERWKKVAASDVTKEGVYAIITTLNGVYRAFTGTITSGHGQTTTSTFTFDEDGFSDELPAGTLELNFIASGDGFLMKHPDETANGNKPYLSASKATSGNLSWLALGDDYWSYSDSNWTYSKVFSGGDHAHLRDYNNTLRTYKDNTGKEIQFAQKVRDITYSNYCTTISGFEKVTLSTDGYITYVTKNAIDWEQTLARNSQDGVDVHGYKVVDFGLDNGVSMVEYGLENLSTVTSTDKMYQEPIIPAGTPIIIQGKQGANYMVVSDEENVAAPAGNLLLASDGNATTTDDVKLFVLQKIDQNGSGIENYAFYKLTKGRTIPEGKAYLSSDNVTLPDPETPGFDPNNVRTANPIRVLVQTNNDPLVSDDAGIIDGIGTVAQDSEDGQVIYNLNGVRVNNPSKGIYVKNGKKVIIK